MVFCGVVKEMVTMPSTRSRKFHAIKLVTQSVCFSSFVLKGLLERHFPFTGGDGLMVVVHARVTGEGFLLRF